MKSKKYLAKGLALGIIVSNLPLYSFANTVENKYYNELSNINTKEDLQKSAQKAVKELKVDMWLEGFTNMPTPRNEATSSVVDGKIYVIGGEDKNDNSNIVEVYDPETDTWETKTPMKYARNRATSSVVDGKIYVIGGAEYGWELNIVEMYDPETDTWETKTPMKYARYSATSSVVDGKIYVMGGENCAYWDNTVEVYDPKTDTWETKTSMNEEKSRLTSSVVNGKIYVMGGEMYDIYDTVEVYDPETDIWEIKTPMPTKKHSLTSGVVDGKIYSIGGYDGTSSSNAVEVYDPATDKWETKTSMPTTRQSATSSIINGKIYVIGGCNRVENYLNTVEAYVAKLSKPILSIKPDIESIDNTLQIKLNSDFNPLDYVVAKDDYYGNLTNDIKIDTNDVDTSSPGRYEVVYSVENKDGQKDVLSLTFKVLLEQTKLNVAPKINATDKTIYVGEVFDPKKDITAIDEEDGDLTDRIKIEENNVNSNIVGKYKVIYSVIDNNGATTKKEISVSVVAKNDNNIENDKNNNNNNLKDDTTSNIKPQTSDSFINHISLLALSTLGLIFINKKYKKKE